MYRGEQDLLEILDSELFGVFLAQSEPPTIPLWKFDKNIDCDTKKMSKAEIPIWYEFSTWQQP